MLVFILTFLAIVFALFFFVFLELILFGSSVDPDDNGLLRSKESKERFKKRKQERMQSMFEETDK